jgi:hypothetical protein
MNATTQKRDAHEIHACRKIISTQVKFGGQQHAKGKPSAKGNSRAQGKENAESKRLTLGSTLHPTPGYKNAGIYIINMQRFFFFFFFFFFFLHKNADPSRVQRCQIRQIQQAGDNLIDNVLMPCCIDINSSNSILKPTHVNESRNEPQVVGRTGSDTICNDLLSMCVPKNAQQTIFFSCKNTVKI